MPIAAMPIRRHRSCLHPVPAARITVKDKRQNIAINLASQRGRQERTLELGFGEWEVEWSGLDASRASAWILRTSFWWSFGL